MKKKNILIVGNNILTQVIADKLIQYENCGQIYIVGSPFNTDTNIQFIDLRLNSVEEIFEFAVKNSVDLTVVTSKEALKANITELFNANDQMIFAPDVNCVKTLTDEGMMKKLLYKLKIPTTKFGIFDKAQSAYEYLKNANFPLVIQACEPKNERDIFACSTMSVAKIAINDLFFKDCDKILIEEYRSGHRFTLFAITDGFKVLPVNVCRTEIFSDCPDGGFITFGSASTLPDNIVDYDIQNHVLKNVLEPIIRHFEKSGTPYLGFIGARCVMSGEEILVEKIYPVIEDSQAAVILNSVDENLINLFNDCVIGSFTDDYEEIKTNSLSSLSVSLFSKTEEKEIKFSQDIYENCKLYLIAKSFNGKLYTHKGFIGVINASANTLSSARNKLYESLNSQTLDGIKYRTDV